MDFLSIVNNVEDRESRGGKSGAEIVRSERIERGAAEGNTPPNGE
jgi:hypothetical protein